MDNFSPENGRRSIIDVSALNSFLSKMYGYMALAVFVSALTAYLTMTVFAKPMASFMMQHRWAMWP